GPTGASDAQTIALPLVSALEPPYDNYDQWSWVNGASLSPDGDRLALSLWRYDYGDDGYFRPYAAVYLVGLDGTGLHRLGSGYEHYFMPAAGWAPTGRQLLYAW